MGARAIIDTREFSGAVSGLVARAMDCRVPLKAWGVYMVGETKQNFYSQGRPTPWAPLKIATLIARYLRGKAKPEGPRGKFDPNPHIFKKAGKGPAAGKADKHLQSVLGDSAAISTVAGFARSSKTGRVLRSRHGGLNKFAKSGYVFRRPAVRAILSGKILIDRGASGGLLGSISSAMDGKTRVIIGTNKEYAGPHQGGWPEKGIPRRSFMVLLEQNVERFAQLLSRWVFHGGSFE